MVLGNKTILSYRPESYFILDLEIPKPNPSLEDCLNSFTDYEILDGDNSWYNEKTKKKEAVKKRITFFSLPKILIITFKRFSIDGTRKRQDLIRFPLKDLNLSNYVNGYNSIGDNHPPKNKIAPIAHISKIFAYSPNQNIAYIMPEYSV